MVGARFETGATRAAGRAGAGGAIFVGRPYRAPWWGHAGPAGRGDLARRRRNLTTLGEDACRSQRPVRPHPGGARHRGSPDRWPCARSGGAGPSGAGHGGGLPQRPRANTERPLRPWPALRRGQLPNCCARRSRAVGRARAPSPADASWRAGPTGSFKWARLWPGFAGSGYGGDQADLRGEAAGPARPRARRPPRPRAGARNRAGFQQACYARTLGAAAAKVLVVATGFEPLRATTP